LLNFKVCEQIKATSIYIQVLVYVQTTIIQT